MVAFMTPINVVLVAQPVIAWAPGPASVEVPVYKIPEYKHNTLSLSSVSSEAVDEH